MKKFFVSVSEQDSREVAIINRQTDDFASLNLESMKVIKKRFKSWINNDKHFCFSFFTPDMVAELEEMLPKHYLSN